MAVPFAVEIWVDLICPWCRIGKQSLERALPAFSQLDWVSFVRRSWRRVPYSFLQPDETVEVEREAHQEIS